MRPRHHRYPATTSAKAAPRCSGAAPTDHPAAVRSGPTRRRTACAAAVGFGLLLLVASLSFWTEYLTTNTSGRTDGHDFASLYLYVFLLYDVSALLLFGPAYRLMRVRKCR